MRVKLLSLFTICIIALQLVSAATIKGVIYDESLHQVEDSIIEINSSPHQRMLSKGGSYSFELLAGDYTLEASVQRDFTELYTQENITISENGKYTIDLILFPDISEQDLDSRIEEIDFSAPVKNTPHLYWLGGIIAFLVLCGVFCIQYLRKEKPGIKEESTKDYLQTILQLLKDHDGRITQKELRKHIPLSESKISLMIAELEHQQKVQKIKKGRGNIIILK